MSHVGAHDLAESTRVGELRGYPLADFALSSRLLASCTHLILYWPNCRDIGASFAPLRSAPRMELVSPRAQTGPAGHGICREVPALWHRLRERHESLDSLRSELVDAAALDDIGYIEGLEVALRIVTPPSS